VFTYETYIQHITDYLGAPIGITKNGWLRSGITPSQPLDNHPLKLNNYHILTPTQKWATTVTALRKIPATPEKSSVAPTPHPAITKCLSERLSERLPHHLPGPNWRIADLRRRYGTAYCGCDGQLMTCPSSSSTTRPG